LFELLRDLGSYVSRQGESPVAQISEALGGAYHYGVAICFDQAGTYRGVKLVEGTDEVIYKHGPSGGCDFTLVSRHSGNLKKTVERLCKNARAIVDEGIVPKVRLLQIKACFQSVMDRIEAVTEDVKGIIPEDAGQDKRVYLFWAILDNDAIIGFYKLPEIQDYLVRAVFKRYGSKSEARVPLMAAERCCTICGKLADEVYGNFTDIACYNLDKPGLITGGFGYAQAVANFPICKSCILDILAGKSYTERHLDFRVAGLSYWLLPKAGDPKLYEVVVRSVKDRQTLGRDLGAITDDEQEIFRRIEDNYKSRAGSGLLTLNLFFYESKQADWRIIAEIREILPSRIQRIFEAKRHVEARPEMAMSRVERGSRYRFTLEIIYSFCGTTQKQSDRRFLTYLEGVFRGTAMKREAIIKDLADGIISAQKAAHKNKNPERAHFKVRDAWATYSFLSMLGIITSEGEIMKDTEDTASENHYESFMKENPGFFSDICRRTAFLTGCYVGAVLYVQQQNRQSQPFSKKFMGRKLDSERLRDLFLQAETKLRQYEALGVVHGLSELVAEAWVQCGTRWTIGDDETTFAFNLGVTLQPWLASRNKEDQLEVKA
jgi:CRISPR-associated protein Csh1